MPTTVTDAATARTVTLTNGAQAARGGELDFNWVATPALQFFGSYGHTRSEIKSMEGARHLIGSPTRRMRARRTATRLFQGLRGR